MNNPYAVGYQPDILKIDVFPTPVFVSDKLPKPDLAPGKLQLVVASVAFPIYQATNAEYVTFSKEQAQTPCRVVDVLTVKGKLFITIFPLPVPTVKLLKAT